MTEPKLLYSRVESRDRTAIPQYGSRVGQISMFADACTEDLTTQDISGYTMATPQACIDLTDSM